jgi:hypothetical protein
MDAEAGPFLMVSALCEKVLLESDGVVSLIRIVDQITYFGPKADAPESMPPSEVPLTMVVSFRSGDFKGKKLFRAIPISPSGAALEAFELPLAFEGNNEFANVIVNLRFMAQEAGVYWIRALLDEKEITQLPLKVLYRPGDRSFESD